MGRPIDGVPMDPVVITLTPGATIDFTLESEDGSGIPRGAILVASWKGAPDVQRTPSGALEGGMRFHVDSYGRVIVDDVPAGIATFYFTCAGYVDKRVRLDVKAGEIHARIVAMELAGELVVTTATDAGEPIPMTFVQVFSTTGEYSASRRTDPSGTCSFGSLPKGQYTVFAIGFPPRTVRVTGETVDIELRSQDR